MSHLNTSIYHCLAVAAKSFLSWDRRICEKCFLRLGEQSAAVQPYLVHVMFLSGPRQQARLCLSLMSTCHSSAHDVYWKHQGWGAADFISHASDAPLGLLTLVCWSTSSEISWQLLNGFIWYSLQTHLMKSNKITRQNGSRNKWIATSWNANIKWNVQKAPDNYLSNFSI